MLTVVAAFIVLLTASSMTAPAAQATGRTGQERLSTPVVTPMAWVPWVEPWFPDNRELRYGNQRLADRNRLINNCPDRFLCLAAGEGNGLHTVYYLYACAERSLSNFIGDGAVANSQTGNPGPRAILKRQDKSTERTIAPGPDPVRVDWDPVYYIDPC
ncbi:hypothetical protein ACGFIW_08070 [Micromonospora sp. NPDC048935]|uniref:hypothetical protein n=1 Tax=Micromonospora sp. NPDC048935 TaxID=3364262 RepID=UPI003714BD82